MLRMNPDGDLLWDRHYGRGALDLPVRTEEITGGDMLLLGGVERSLMRLNSQGDSLWGIELPFDNGVIHKKADGNILLFGSAPPWSSERKGTHLMTVNTSGTVLTDLDVSSTPSLSFRVNTLACSKRGDYLLAGTSNSDIFVSTMDENGQPGTWTCTLGGGWFDEATAIQELADGTILVVGKVHNDLLVARLRRG